MRLPDVEGWWARRRGGEVKWFHVVMASDTGDLPLAPCIYVSDFERYEEAAKFTTAATRWFGPFDLPDGWDS